MDFKQMCRIIIGVYFSDKFFIFYISYVYLDCQYMSGDKWKYPHHETIVCPWAELHPALLLKQYRNDSSARQRHDEQIMGLLQLFLKGLFSDGILEIGKHLLIKRK